jgi:dTDP-4-amino-4,6-dideoxygalactose transaminase
MQAVQAPRASAILYRLLVGRDGQNPWLLPANICPIVLITFLKARVPFHFLDISTRTLHMDLEQAEALVGRRTYGGLLYAHTYGEASTPNDFFASLKSLSPDLMIIDDRCLCVPDLEADSASQADVQLYSTGYAKIVDLGFGGYAFSRETINDRNVSLPFSPQDHDQIEKAYKDAISRRAKFVYQDSDWLDTETAVPAWEDYSAKIKTELAHSLSHRASLNRIYAAMLPAEIQLPASFQTWRFNIRVRDQRRVLEAIFSSGLFASSHYASLAGIMDDGKAPQAEALAEGVINLFNDHHFTAQQAEHVCQIILENLA